MASGGAGRAAARTQQEQDQKQEERSQALPPHGFHLLPVNLKGTKTLKKLFL
jgi:hypothetical protein